MSAGRSNLLRWLIEHLLHKQYLDGLEAIVLKLANTKMMTIRNSARSFSLDEISYSLVFGILFSQLNECQNWSEIFLKSMINLQIMIVQRLELININVDICQLDELNVICVQE